MHINYSNFNTSLQFGAQRSRSFSQKTQPVRTYLNNLKETLEKSGDLKNFQMNVPEHMEIFQKQNPTCKISKSTWVDYAKYLGIKMRTHQEATIEALNKRNNDPVFKKQHAERSSELQKARWQNPEYREHHLSLLKEIKSAPAEREKQSKLMTELHQDPAFKDKVAQGNAKALKKKWQTPESRQLQSEVMKVQRQNPEFEAKRVEGFLRYYAGFLVKKVHGNVNRSTGKVIDYADPQGVTPLEGVQQKELRAAVRQALNELKEDDSLVYHIVCKEMGIPTKSASKLPEEPLSDKQKTNYLQKGLEFLRIKLSDFRDV